MAKSVKQAAAKNGAIGNNRIAIWTAVITGAVAIVVASIQFGLFSNKNEGKEKQSVQETTRYTVSGTILEATSGKVIPMAQIDVVGRNESYTSETNGNFSIEFKTENEKTVRLRVSKAGYKTHDKSYDLPSKGIIVTLVLDTN